MKIRLAKMLYIFRVDSLIRVQLLYVLHLDKEKQKLFCTPICTINIFFVLNRKIIREIKIILFSTLYFIVKVYCVLVTNILCVRYLFLIKLIIYVEFFQFMPILSTFA